MDIGYKAATAAFAQDAISWYPDRQADWLLKSSSKTKAALEAELSTIDREHRHFAGCQSVRVTRAGINLQLSASAKPLPFQYDPKPGVISHRFRWGDYNEPVKKQTAPAGAVTLAALEALR